MTVEVTTYVKADGPLTKRLSLAPDDTLVSDGAACVMSNGTARRVRLDGVEPFAALIAGLGQSEAISLGTLRSGLPDNVEIVTKRSLERMNGAAAPYLIARTGAHIQYRPGQPALALIDIDQKGITPEVEEIVRGCGGFRESLGSVLPRLLDTSGVIRSSTSSGLVRTDTGETLPASGGLHWYVLVQDGTDIERFLKTMHDRCWAAGLGWLIVSKAGQLLERSIVDRMVGAPERIVFEGRPVVVPPLVQDGRLPEVLYGEALDTRTACPDLNSAEQERVRALKRRARNALAQQVEAARSAFIGRQAGNLRTRLGIPDRAARRIVEAQFDGILLPEVSLPFDNADFAGKTVADVLADPETFIGATLADPLEGIEYGRGKAKILRRRDGSLWIHSFAHGRTAYDLQHDAKSVEAIIQSTAPDETATAFVELLGMSQLDADEEQRLRELVMARAGVKARPLAAKVKAASAARAKQKAEEESERRAAERADPRYRLPCPAPDAERVPVMRALDYVLSRVSGPEPPMRELGGLPIEVRSRPPLLLHELTGAGSNGEEAENSRLPPPELPLLTLHDKYSFTHLVEQHIEYVTEDRPVALPSVFIDHFMAYRDSILPRVGAVVTTPLVLADGTLLAISGVDKQRKLVFRIDPALLSYIPVREACTKDAVAEAMRFLLDEWLVDVSASFTDKCVLISAALTILERVLFPERPAFFVTAGQRGGGKTTAVSMILLAVTGRRPPAAAWSPNEEERRKALLAYMIEGLPALVWDNIPRGMSITCPHIEKSLTQGEISDRVLCKSENRTASTSTVQFFTGNNIGSRGDMASRALNARITVDRPDPENRSFKHEDPCAWTLNNRGRILQALYTVLLGNPQLDPEQAKARKTRFKTWWHLVGSAVEHGASLLVKAEPEPAEGKERKTSPVSFADLLTAYEAEEEQTSALATVLDILADRWPDKLFLATQVADLINQPMQGDGDKGNALRASIEQASGRALPVVSSTTINWRLKAFVDAPVVVGGAAIMTLRLIRAEKAADGTERKKHDLTSFKVSVVGGETLGETSGGFPNQNSAFSKG